MIIMVLFRNTQQRIAGRSLGMSRASGGERSERLSRPDVQQIFLQ